VIKNNIFDYASKELSQDAFLCWCLNWNNYASPMEPLYPMARELLERLLGEQIREGQQVIIRQQLQNIDMLVVLKGRNRVLLIEDKVYACEHDDQIARYRQMLRELPNWQLKELEIDAAAEIRTVYFKTGFHYDCDKDTVADCKIDGPDFLALLEKYQNHSEILDAYADQLRRRVAWYTQYGRYENTPSKHFWDWNISRHTIAQHNLMHDIFRQRFPASLHQRGTKLFMIRTGANQNGRPWTEFPFSEAFYPGSDRKYDLFWRIDTNRNGPYLSLRFYEWFTKTDETEQKRHIAQYQILRKKAADFLAAHKELGLHWDDVKGGYTGGYYESTILSINLRDVLYHWTKEQEETLRRQAVALSEAFLTL